MVGFCFRVSLISNILLQSSPWSTMNPQFPIINISKLCYQRWRFSHFTPCSGQCTETATPSQPHHTPNPWCQPCFPSALCSLSSMSPQLHVPSALRSLSSMSPQPQVPSAGTAAIILSLTFSQTLSDQGHTRMHAQTLALTTQMKLDERRLQKNNNFSCSHSSSSAC